MSIIKIIPCLDIKNGRMVKGINFVNLRDADDPGENAAFYEKEGADALAMHRNSSNCRESKNQD